MEQKSENRELKSKSPEFEKDIDNHISCIKCFGENGNFSEINYDLLAFAMSELIGNKTFIELPSERRKELFDQYITLRSLLDHLQEFVSDLPLLEKGRLYAITNQ